MILGRRNCSGRNAECPEMQHGTILECRHENGGDQRELERHRDHDSLDGVEVVNEEL